MSNEECSLDHVTDLPNQRFCDMGCTAAYKIFGMESLILSIICNIDILSFHDLLQGDP